MSATRSEATIYEKLQDAREFRAHESELSPQEWNAAKNLASEIEGLIYERFLGETRDRLPTPEEENRIYETAKVISESLLIDLDTPTRSQGG